MADFCKIKGNVIFAFFLLKAILQQSPVCRHLSRLSTSYFDIFTEVYFDVIVQTFLILVWLLL